MTPDDFLGRVRDLLPAVRDRTARAEELRRLPDETFAEFQEAGLFRAMQPKRYGGFELDPGTFYRGVMDVAAVCGSTGWIFAVMGAHNWHLALFPPQAQEDVWGGDDSVQLSTSLAPTGKIERAEGGFRVSGRWSFSSGCDFCHWVVLGGLAPPAEEGAPPDLRTFLLPRADYEIDDNWHVMGLCGTGSKDIVVKDAFVPEYRTHSYRDAFHLKNPAWRSTTRRCTGCRSASCFPIRSARRRSASRPARSRVFASSSRSASTSATGRAPPPTRSRIGGLPSQRPRSTPRATACSAISPR